MSKEEKESKAKARVFSFNVHKQSLAKLKGLTLVFVLMCHWGSMYFCLLCGLKEFSLCLLQPRKFTWDFLPGVILRACFSVGSLSVEDVWTMKIICNSPLLPWCSIFLNQSSFLGSHIATQYNFYRFHFVFTRKDTTKCGYSII